MGVLAGMDSDVWVSASPSVALAAGEGCNNTDAGVRKQYTAMTHLYWDKYTAVVVQVGTDAKQQIAITGSPTGGTFTLTFGGNTTTALSWNSTAAQIDTALGLLASIGGAANVICTGGPLPATPVVVEFALAKGGAPQATMTHTDSLTGGASPAVAITSTQTGIAWATQATTLYTFQYVGGIVTFVSALAATQVVQILSGNYFTVSQLANCSEWTLDMKAAVIDVSVFQSGGWGAFQSAMFSASGKIASFVSDGTLDTSLSNLMVFILYVSKTANSRYECYGWLSDEAIKNSMKGVITKDISFVTDGQVYFRPN